MSADQASDTKATIYVRLLGEGTDVWRPVPASRLIGTTNVFRLGEPYGYAPEIDTFEFLPGSLVECELKRFADGGDGLVALALA
jgi:hypothetical protein